MRITFVLPFAGHTGGVRVVATYARILHERGHRVTVVSLPYERKMGRKEKLKSYFGIGKEAPPIPTTLLDFLGERHVRLEEARPVLDSDVPDSDVIVATWWETAHWVSKLSSEKGIKFYLIQGYEVFPHLPAERVIET